MVGNFEGETLQAREHKEWACDMYRELAQRQLACVRHRMGGQRREGAAGRHHEEAGLVGDAREVGLAEALYRLVRLVVCQVCDGRTQCTQQLGPRQGHPQSGQPSGDSVRDTLAPHLQELRRDYAGYEYALIASCWQKAVQKI